MEVYLEDIQEAQGLVVRTKRKFLEERGWEEQTFSFKQTTLWKKQFNIPRDKASVLAEAMTIDEAIDMEVSFGKSTHPFSK